MNPNPTPLTTKSRTQQKRDANIEAQRNWATQFKGTQAYQAEGRRAAINALLDPRSRLTATQKRGLLKSGVDVGGASRTEPKDGYRKLLVRLNNRPIAVLGRYQTRARNRARRLESLIPKAETSSAAPVTPEAGQGGVFGFLGKLRRGLKKGFERATSTILTRNLPVAGPGQASPFLKERHDRLLAFGRAVDAVLRFRADAVASLQLARGFSRKTRAAA